MTCFSIGLQKDLKYAKRIQKLIEKNHSDKVSSTTLKIRKKRNSISLIIYGKKFAEWIYKYCGRYSYAKKLHIDVINESNKKLKKLIDCFRLGDGHTRNSNGLDITLTTISDDLAWQLWNMLLRIGEFSSIRQQNRKNRKYNDFQIHYRPERKQFRFYETKNGYFLPITSIIKEKYDGVVKNLWIDSEEHIYRSGGCLQKNCHDEWFHTQDSWDISQYLASHTEHGYWLGFRGLINVIVGEQTYPIYARHKYRRHSSDNLCWGMLYKLRKIKTPIDIMVGAHNHMPDVRIVYEKEQKTYLFKGGAYKPFDRFLEHHDVDPAPAIMPAAYLKADRHEIIPFMDFKDLKDIL